MQTFFKRGDCSPLTSLTVCHSPRSQRPKEPRDASRLRRIRHRIASNKALQAVEFCVWVAATVDDPQIAVALLSMCNAVTNGARRVTHLMKTLPPQLIAPALNLLVGAVLVAFERADGVSVPTGKLDVFLLLSMSGFGLRHCLHLSYPANLTSKMISLQRSSAAAAAAR